jgi:archaellum component FlaG (FlaF/FlaG flagellin family)
MDFGKAVKYFLAALAGLALLYGLFLAGTTIYGMYLLDQADDSAQDLQENAENIQPPMDVTVNSLYAQEGEYIMYLQNTDQRPLNLSNIKIEADNEDITDQISYQKSLLEAGDTAIIETGVESGSDVKFEITHSGNVILEYECEYNENASSC